MSDSLCALILQAGKWSVSLVGRRLPSDDCSAVQQYCVPCYVMTGSLLASLPHLH